MTTFETVKAFEAEQDKYVDFVLAPVLPLATNPAELLQTASLVSRNAADDRTAIIVWAVA